MSRGKKKKPEDQAPIIPIDNLPVIEADWPEIPDEYKFEILRLRRELSETQADLRRAHKKIVRAGETVYNELRFWKLGLTEKQWESPGEIQERVRRLESTLKILDDTYPTGDVPELTPRWQSDKGQP